MFIIKHKKIFLGISTLLIIFSIFSIFYFKLNFGIDFTGGTMMEVSYINNDRPEISQVQENLKQIEILKENFSIQSAGENSLLLRMPFISETDHVEILNTLNFNNTYEIQETRLSAIGPVIGEEMKNKAIIAIIFVVIAIILFIAFSFRKVKDFGKESVSSWKYEITAIIALMHDILIPTGIFAFLGSFFIEYEVNVLFVTALLAILGFSVNDTIVVFDRIRENLKLSENKKQNFEEIIGQSLRQTFIRSLNTSLTTLFVLIFLYFFGQTSTQQFALVLGIGVIAGTYSSICFASPLLIMFNNLKK
jgi:preprotein translocase subunit SecF